MIKTIMLATFAAIAATLLHRTMTGIGCGRLKTCDDNQEPDKTDFFRANGLC